MKKFLKDVKKIITNIDIIIVKAFGGNRFFAIIYYFLIPSFRRENKAVLSGRQQYYSNLKKKGGNFFYLRRSIHRIEKGILMRPRREVFAESYIEETVENYVSLIEKNEKSTSLLWANDVLVNYFDIVDASTSFKIKKSKAMFFDHSLDNTNNLIPYKRNIKNKPAISLEEFNKLSIYRRSVRWFLNIKVEHTKIDNALLIAMNSPSACNRLPYKFKIFDNKEKVIEIANSAMGTTGYLDNIPTIVAVVGDLSAYPEERDRHLIYIDSSLAAMSFVFGLEVQGVSSCIINWPDIEKREKKIDNILNLKAYERVTMLIAIGYEDPKGMVAYSKKKDLNEGRQYN